MTTILVAEDDAATARLLRVLLELEGFSVQVAAQSQAAWTVWQSHSPDVALIDMHLSQAEGLDLLRMARRDPILANAAVVITSAMDRRDEALAAGADAFLLKPFDRAELLQAIRNALAGRQS